MAAAGGASIEVLEERVQHIVETIKTQIEAGMDAINRRLDGLDGRMLALENCQTKEVAVSGERLNAMEKKLLDHDQIARDSVADRKNLGSRVQELESRMKLVYWIMGTIAGVVIVALTGALVALVLK